jgi:hypothetical protein
MTAYFSFTSHDTFIPSAPLRGRGGGELLFVHDCTLSHALLFLRRLWSLVHAAPPAVLQHCTLRSGAEALLLRHSYFGSPMRACFLLLHPSWMPVLPAALRHSPLRLGAHALLFWFCSGCMFFASAPLLVGCSAACTYALYAPFGRASTLVVAITVCFCAYFNVSPSVLRCALQCVLRTCDQCVLQDARQGVLQH